MARLAQLVARARGGDGSGDRRAGTGRRLAPGDRARAGELRPRALTLPLRVYDAGPAKACKLQHFRYVALQHEQES